MNMNDDDRVCPDCGNDVFEARYCVYVERRVRVTAWGVEEVWLDSDSTLDSEREDELRCAECYAAFDEADLPTRAAYDAEHESEDEC